MISKKLIIFCIRKVFSIISAPIVKAVSDAIAPIVWSEKPVVTLNVCFIVCIALKLISLNFEGYKAVH